MKEIGESFREARETIGISKTEVIKDLNITESQLDNLEDGLNLDEDDIMDKFNDFMFGYTSRIPIEDILEQTREINIIEKQNEVNKIASPYTVKRKKKSGLKYAIIYIVSVIILVILVVLIVKFITDKTTKETLNNNYIVEKMEV